VIHILKGLAIEGKFGLFSCSSTCPSFLFKDNLTEKVTTDDSSSSLFGRIELAECELSKNFMESELHIVLNRMDLLSNMGGQQSKWDAP
jgi:hypothetical protein